MSFEPLASEPATPWESAPQDETPAPWESARQDETPARRERRDIRPLLGLFTLGVALLALGLEISAWLSSLSGLTLLADGLAWAAVVVSAGALVAAAVALIVGWGKLAAAGAFGVALLANPLIVYGVIAAGRALTPY